MVSEYIEKQVAIDAVKGRFSMPVDNLIVEVMNAIPPADVRPVVRAEWRYHPEATWQYECPICNSYVPAAWNYCPECNADMRGNDVELF